MVAARPRALEPHVRPFADPGVPLDSLRGDLQRIKDDDPLVLMRRWNRIAQSDNESLDKVASLDELYREMERYSIIRATRSQLLGRVMARGLKWQGADERRVAFAEWQWGPQQRLLASAVRYVVEAYLRGFRLGEITWSARPIADGPHQGLDWIRRIKQIDVGNSTSGATSAVVVWEDAAGQAWKVRCNVPDGTADPLTGSWPSKQREVKADAPEWQRLLFLTFPADSGRLRGEGALEACFPPWYSAIHFRQWKDSFAEKLGSGVLIGRLGEGIDPARFAREKDALLTLMGNLKTHARIVLPPGWELDFKTMEAAAVGDFFDSCTAGANSDIETAILTTSVTSGAKVEGGTYGSNMMASATSDTLISNLQEITLGVVFDLHARVDRANFGGDSEMPTAEWDTTDDAKEDRKLNRASKGLADGVLSKHDPRVIALYGLTPLDGDDLAAAAAHQASMVAAGLAPASAQPMDAQGVAVVLGQYRDGEIGPTAAALLLSQALPNASAERINRILEEERRAVAAVTVEGEPAAAQAAPEATTPAEEGMNGAQIAALQEIVAGVSGRTTAPGAAVLMIQTAFPLLPAGRAQAIVDQAAAFAPAAPTPETQRAFAEVFARLEARLGNPAYDNSRPPPIRQDLVRAAREVPLSEVEAVAFADETVPRVWEWLSTVDYADATVRATTVATMARHYATEATRNAS